MTFKVIQGHRSDFIVAHIIDSVSILYDKIRYLTVNKNNTNDVYFLTYLHYLEFVVRFTAILLQILKPRTSSYKQRGYVVSMCIYRVSSCFGVFRNAQ